MAETPKQPASENGVRPRFDLIKKLADAVDPKDAAPPQDATPQGRRDFFAQAMRETLTPLTGILENKINPVLQALEDIPRRAEALAQQNLLPTLDQPHVTTPGLEDVHLPVFHGSTPQRILRPPGATDKFADLCTACAKCVEACPAQCIRIDLAGGKTGFADGLPYIAAVDAPCVVCDDLSCMKVCPTGALTLVDKFAINMGKAKVDHDTCLRAHGEECRLCVDACPLGEHAIAISTNTGRVAVKYHGCIGCGLCENRCPTEPRAITVQPPTPKIDALIA